MAGTDRQLDQKTGDYIDDGSGSWKMTTTLETQVRHQILDELNKWPGDADAGSDGYKFGRAKNSEISARRLAESVRRALNVFVTKGLATDVLVDVKRSTTGRWVLVGSLIDIQHGEIDLTPLLAFGA